MNSSAPPACATCLHVWGEAPVEVVAVAAAASMRCHVMSQLVNTSKFEGPPMAMAQSCASRAWEAFPAEGTDVPQVLRRQIMQRSSLHVISFWGLPCKESQVRNGAQRATVGETEREREICSGGHFCPGTVTRPHARERERERETESGACSGISGGHLAVLASA